MSELYISDFIEMQRQLREKHDWDEHTPENGRNSILWSVDELGEVIAIIKKKGDRAIMDNPAVREHFVEECSDVLMYLFDMFDCYGITGREFCDAYREKWERNMNRSWSENAKMYEAGDNTDKR